MLPLPTPQDGVIDLVDPLEFDVRAGLLLGVFSRSLQILGHLHPVLRSEGDRLPPSKTIAAFHFR